MDIDDHKLRELYTGYAAKRPRSRTGCPSSAEIISSFEMSASARRKKKIIDHMSRCSDCREEFMILLDYHKPKAEPGSAPIPMDRPGSYGPDGPKRSMRPVFWRYAGAFLGLGIVLTSLVVLKHQKDVSMALRSAQPGITLLAPKAGRHLTGPPVFRWRSSAPCQYCLLELFDQDLLPVWTSEKLFGDEARPPLSVSAALRPGQRYFWMVTAFADGSKVEESVLGSFVLDR